MLCKVSLGKDCFENLLFMYIIIVFVIVYYDYVIINQVIKNEDKKCTVLDNAYKY